MNEAIDKVKEAIEAAYEAGVSYTEVINIASSLWIAGEEIYG